MQRGAQHFADDIYKDDDIVMNLQNTQVQTTWELFDSVHNQKLRSSLSVGCESNVGE
jgi:hypothetical protein